MNNKQMSQFKDFSEFLAKHNAKNEKGTVATHTRIGEKDLNITFKIDKIIM